MKKRLALFAMILTAAGMTVLVLQSCSDAPFERTDDGMTVRLNGKSQYPGQAVRLRVINDRIIRVSAVPSGEFPETSSLMAVTQNGKDTEFTIEKGEGHVTLSTSSLSAEVSLTTGMVRFTGNDGTVFLSEAEGGGRSFMPVMAMNETGYTVRQQFESDPVEAIYGLGANQTSFMNLRGKDADLFQYNTLAVVPFIISNRNYGILWDNNSRTKYGDIREWNELSSLKLRDSQGSAGGLTAVYADRRTGKKVFTTRNEKEINYQFIPDLVKFPEGLTWVTGR